MAERSTIYDYRDFIDAVDASICMHLGCEGHLVHPIAWGDPAINGLTKVVLRCPDCEGRREGYMNDEQAGHLGRFMDIGKDVVQNELIELASVRQFETLQSALEQAEDEERQA
ncbi:MAG: hypothetical protein Q7T74_05035 [Candidatus Saccharibacteria bacterium]|nr:hypothetical protein [Candidatus Saccharibacteria bacterium]